MGGSCCLIIRIYYKAYCTSYDDTPTWRDDHAARCFDELQIQFVHGTMVGGQEKTNWRLRVTELERQHATIQKNFSSQFKAVPSNLRRVETTPKVEWWNEAAIYSFYCYRKLLQSVIGRQRPPPNIVVKKSQEETMKTMMMASTRRINLTLALLLFVAATTMMTMTTTAVEAFQTDLLTSFTCSSSNGGGMRRRSLSTTAPTTTRTPVSTLLSPSSSRGRPAKSFSSNLYSDMPRRGADNRSSFASCSSFSSSFSSSALLQRQLHQSNGQNPPDTGSSANANDGHHDSSKSLLNFFLQQEYLKKKDRFQDLLPPPPEDRFIMTGDIFVLFFYAFTSHSLNDYIVNGVLSDPGQSIQQAVRSLDPMGEVVNLQSVPVWVETQNSLTVNHVLSVQAQESLLNHWGPLFSTEGLACVTLCSCWLLAGWVHRAFHFSNSVDCSTDQALSKVLETWLSMAVLLVTLSVSTAIAVDHFFGPHYDLPTLFLQQQRNLLLCGDVKCAATAATTGHSAASTVVAAAMAGAPQLLTKADGMFIVDSMSVLVAWRFMANRILNMWR